MQLQAKTAFFLLGLAWVSSAHAACFDFSKVIKQPLHPPVAHAQSGTSPHGWVWAAVRGVVNRPLNRIVLNLEQHKATKSSQVNKMTLTNLHDARYLLKQRADMEVDPFPFVRVQWSEIWAFALTEGTLQAPRQVVVSYEKTHGTSHIQHLCGSFVLKRLSKNKTDVFIYEEVRATGRSVKDELNGLKGTLKALGKS